MRETRVLGFAPFRLDLDLTDPRRLPPLDLVIGRDGPGVVDVGVGIGGGEASCVERNGKAVVGEVNVDRLLFRERDRPMLVVLLVGLLSRRIFHEDVFVAFHEFFAADSPSAERRAGSGPNCFTWACPFMSTAPRCTTANS